MFFIFFIGIPIIEVILFITIGKYIGLWNTILIIIITILSFITGVPIMKRLIGFIKRIRGEKQNNDKILCRYNEENVYLKKGPYGEYIRYKNKKVYIIIML